MDQVTHQLKTCHRYYTRIVDFSRESCLVYKQLLHCVWMWMIVDFRSAFISLSLSLSPLHSFLQAGKGAIVKPMIVISSSTLALVPARGAYRRCMYSVAYP